MSIAILSEISENLQKGKAKIVAELVQKALDEGVAPDAILNEGLLSGTPSPTPQKRDRPTAPPCRG